MQQQLVKLSRAKIGIALARNMPFPQETSSRPSATSNTYGHPAQLWHQTIQGKKATGFLRRFGFEVILRRSHCDVWETKEKPKVRALMFQNRDGLYVGGQLRWGNADG